jgi:hypothetical protein
LDGECRQKEANHKDGKEQQNAQGCCLTLMALLLVEARLLKVLLCRHVLVNRLVMDWTPA